MPNVDDSYVWFCRLNSEVDSECYITGLGGNAGFYNPKSTTKSCYKKPLAPYFLSTNQIIVTFPNTITFSSTGVRADIYIYYV